MQSKWHYHQPGNLCKQIIFEYVCKETIKTFLSCAMEVNKCIPMKFSLR